MTPSTPDRRPPHHEFSLELERARREAGLQGKDLAARLFVAPRTVRRYLNGERLPTIELTEAWERVCEIEPGRLSRHHPGGARSALSLVAESDVSSPAAKATPGQEAAAGSDSRRPLWRRWWALTATAAVVAGAVALGLTLSGGEPTSKAERTVARAKQLSTTYVQRTGSSARTWSDFTIAGGKAGPPINGPRSVRVTCRVRGFDVGHGNDWWYLVASAPWRNRYFATADAFFNQRRTQGVDFRKTRFVDPAVPRCP